MAVSIVVVTALAWSGSIARTQSPHLELATLSSRPALVSGGDALVAVRAPGGVTIAQLTLTLNGRDVTSRLKAEPDGTFRGLVDGMIVGQNRLVASLKSPARGDASLTVTNHPISGPILSGPHLKPFECSTEKSGLGPALDANCSAPRKIWYVYRTTGGQFKALSDPAGARPSDLATTTTSEGKTVPYIVRVDGGVINRAIYQLAVLDDPTSATVNPEAYTPSAGWNRKLMVTFGGSSGTQYIQGVQAPPVTETSAGGGAVNHTALSRGFAHLVSTELVNGRRGNGVLQGETLMMIKEYIIERYGVPKWTVGSGGSGGAIQQLVITQMYPGLLDGLMPSLSFPDSSLHTMDSVLLEHLWPQLDPKVWTQAKKTAVEGFTPGTSVAWNRAYGRLGVPSNASGCALADVSLVYDPVRNPKGARCTTQDIRANVYGRDPKTGFARRPTDNVGVQYGLAGLNSGALTVDEFLDINEKIGGTDIDGTFIATRTEGDPVAIKGAYESGLMASYGRALANVPILMSRTYTDSRGDIHDRQRDFVIRARLEKSNGRSDNTVIWISGGGAAGGAAAAGARGRAGAGRAGSAAGRGRGAAPSVADGGSQATEPAAAASPYSTLDTMTKWLDGIAGDPSPLNIDKVVKHKPAEAVDTCWDAAGKKIVEPASFESRGPCNALYPVHTEPRLVAGAPLVNDVFKCRLKSIEYGDYKVAFTDEQKTRMKKVFSTGVCDFSKPGVNQVPLKGTYQKY
jgi:hypothetical protein